MNALNLLQFIAIIKLLEKDLVGKDCWRWGKSDLLKVDSCGKNPEKRFSTMSVKFKSKTNWLERILYRFVKQIK